MFDFDVVKCKKCGLPFRRRPGCEEGVCVRCYSAAMERKEEETGHRKRVRLNRADDGSVLVPLKDTLAKTVKDSRDARFAEAREKTTSEDDE